MQLLPQASHAAYPLRSESASNAKTRENVMVDRVFKRNGCESPFLTDGVDKVVDWWAWLLIKALLSVAVRFVCRP
jgi:hypothetical protein